MSANPDGQRMARPQRYARLKTLRDQGLLLREIAEQEGLAIQTVHMVLDDPTGDKARARKRRYERKCVGCGRTINPNGIRAETIRCQTCEGAHRRELTRRWIIESFQEWANMFGAPPSSYDWNPAHVRLRGFAGSQWRVARYERTGRPWPSTTTVIENFGSWNEALRTAGFQPLTPSQYPIGHAGVALAAEEAA